jgi:hypothetical protein
MAKNKITFGKPKTEQTKPAYTPETSPVNIDNRQVYDFGKKYAVLEYKFNELKDGAVYTAGFNVEQKLGFFTFTTTFFNASGKPLNSSSIDVPEGTPIESVELDYEGKRLVIHTVGGDDIVADLSELIDKVDNLDNAVDNLDNTVFMPDVITDEEELSLVSPLGEVTNDNLDLGERGEHSGENLNLDSEKTVAFYNKLEIDKKLVTLNTEAQLLSYEALVGTSIEPPEDARTWFDPSVNGEEEFTPFSVMEFGGGFIEDETSGFYTENVEEQQISLSDDEMLVTFSTDSNNDEETPGFMEDDSELQSTSTTNSVEEQELGSQDSEVQYSFSTDPSNEQEPGLIDSETNGEFTENTPELSPGFLENELN